MGPHGETVDTTVCTEGLLWDDIGYNGCLASEDVVEVVLNFDGALNKNDFNLRQV